MRLYVRRRAVRPRITSGEFRHAHLTSRVRARDRLPHCQAPLVSQDRQENEPKPPEGFTLETADTIEFTTDEVTWMQVDVSPDGRTIVFDLLGDLYTMPIDGGSATRIMGGLSFESQPTWSPDGKTIAFLSDRTGVENLWIANADGSIREPSARTEDQRSPADHGVAGVDARRPVHRRLEVASAGSGHVLAVHVSPRRRHRRSRRSPPPPQPGPDAQGPPPPPAPNRMGSVVSPDGRFIYYAQRTGTFTYNAQFPFWQIYRHDRETGESAGHQRARHRRFVRRFPDGKWLVYGTRHKTQTGLRGAISRPAPSDGSSIRSLATIRSRARAATCCLATTSRPTASRSSFRSAESFSASISKAARAPSSVHGRGESGDRTAGLHTRANGGRPHRPRATDPMANRIA